MDLDADNQKNNNYIVYEERDKVMRDYDSGEDESSSIPRQPQASLCSTSQLNKRGIAIYFFYPRLKGCPANSHKDLTICGNWEEPRAGRWLTNTWRKITNESKRQRKSLEADPKLVHEDWDKYFKSVVDIPTQVDANII